MTTKTLSNYDSNEAFAEVLVGRKIVAAGNESLTLDDGTVLEIEPNYGCGGCPSGNYWIDQLVSFDNVITNVQLELGESEDGTDDRYSLFVYSGAVFTEAMAIEGNVGNGYYGSGFEITVKKGD